MLHMKDQKAQVGSLSSKRQGRECSILDYSVDEGTKRSRSGNTFLKVHLPEYLGNSSLRHCQGRVSMECTGIYLWCGAATSQAGHMNSVCIILPSQCMLQDYTHRNIDAGEKFTLTKCPSPLALALALGPRLLNLWLESYDFVPCLVLFHPC